MDGDLGDAVIVDGRKIKKEIYPDNFNFNLIKRCKKEGNDRLINFNNLVMEQHIVNADDYKMPKPFDVNKIYRGQMHNMYKDINK